MSKKAQDDIFNTEKNPKYSTRGQLFSQMIGMSNFSVGGSKSREELSEILGPHNTNSPFGTKECTTLSLLGY